MIQFPQGWRVVVERFAEQLKAVPTVPGVYLMRDEARTIIYVGKAVNLRNRLRSYFGSPRHQAPKTRKLVQRIADFEYIVTESELEALILECTLIKQHRPKYNVVMKDDKNYPYLKVTLNEEWPQVIITRRMLPDGARYFGPYADVGSVRRTLDLLNKLFPYRSCDRIITGKDARPCLDFHIKRCLGPCIGAVEHDAYLEVIRQVILFLEGRSDEVARRLRRQMDSAAGLMLYERAAVLRDQIQAVEKVGERQKVVSAKGEDQDVIAFARDNGEAVLQVFFIRNGRLIGREHFVLEGAQEEDNKQLVSSFVKQFYDQAVEVPPKILLPNPLDEEAIIESWLRNKRGEKVKLSVPKQGDSKRLVEMVAENAEQVMEQLRVKWLADRNQTGQALTQLSEALGLAGPPRRIECYDISHTQGQGTVGAMAVFEEGKPKTAHYRRFKIKTVLGSDDYASIAEVIRRRFKYLAAKEAETGPDGRAPEAESSSGFNFGPPDLVIIDGGKGQLAAAREVMKELGLDGIPMTGLAKENEELYLPLTNDPVILPRTSQALYLIQRIRDEAHRFAITYHRQVRGKVQIMSSLDHVRGIGPVKKKALIRHFGSVKAIRDATVDDVAAVPGMTRALAEQVKSAL